MLDQIVADGPRSTLLKKYGVSVDECVKMGPKQLLALNLRLQFREARQLDAILSRRVTRTAVVGETAVLSLSGTGDKNKVKLRRQGGKWYLLDVDF